MKEKWNGVNPELTEERIAFFWSKITRDGPNGCWRWHACKKNGYGVMRYITTKDGGQTGAHRISWIIHNGPIPDDQFVLHRCDNPECCNPEHHFLGTQQVNRDDCVEKRRQARGESHGIARLTAAQVDEIRRIYPAVKSTRKLAKQFNVGASTIKRVLRGETWSAAA